MTSYIFTHFLTFENLFSYNINHVNKTQFNQINKSILYLLLYLTFTFNQLNRQKKEVKKKTNLGKNLAKRRLNLCFFIFHLSENMVEDKVYFLLYFHSNENGTKSNC